MISTTRRLCMQWILLLALAAMQSARASGWTPVAYPTQSAALFTVELPSGWTIKVQGEDDAEDYVEVTGVSGLQLSFRTLSAFDLDAAIEAHVLYIEENYADVSVEKVVESRIHGIDVVLLPAVGTDVDGKVRELRAGWFKLSAEVLGELWYSVDRGDLELRQTAASVLNSVRSR